MKSVYRFLCDDEFLVVVGAHVGEEPPGHR